VKASKGNKKKNRSAGRIKDSNKNRRRQLLPALMAVGSACGIMVTPAAALELGELKIDSSLGQPLRASIAYALNPHEGLYDFCVYLRPGLAANGLPTLSKATVSIADGKILLTGGRAIREPLLTMQVSIDCPYTANLSREYTLMLNPPTPVIREQPLATEPSTASETPVTTVTAKAPKSQPGAVTRRNVDQSPIAQNSRYLVQRGDTAGDIASRIEDRSMALWPAVDRIFGANPDAFMDSDINRLKAGSWLEIPDLSVAAQEVTPAPTTVADAPPSEAAEFSAYTGYDAAVVADESPLVTDESPLVTDEATVVTEVADPPVSEADTSNSDFAELRPGDVVVGSDNPFLVATGAEADTTETIDIPDTEILQPALQPVPVVSTSQGNEIAGKTSGSWSWLIWLGGTGLALILGLLLFGQRFRQRFGSVAVGVASEPLPSRRRTDANAQPAATVQDVDFQVPDESPHSASLTLDADFGDGSGLQDTSDMDVAQDFGFSASSTFDEELDMVLPEGADAEDDSGPTDIIEPSARPEDSVVVDNEVMPNEDDDADYDLSMIVDVTKQDVVEFDATEKDLQAVQVDSDSKPASDDYTVNKDVDYKVLEQDYEDEFTATRALNLEIEKAAAQLADRMDIDATGEMTAQLPRNAQAQNDDVNDLYVTGSTEEITAEIQATDDDVTVEMPADENAVTAEMEVESGIVDTKKKKKAS